MFTPANFAAALLLLIPYLAVAFFPARMVELVRRLPLWAQLAGPALLVVPYVLVTGGADDFRCAWFVLYLGLPPGIAALLWQARQVDSESAKDIPSARRKEAGPWTAPFAKGANGFAQDDRAAFSARCNWREFAVLVLIGLAVDLRWFERAWPAGLSIFNKVLLLDAGIYGFVLIRQLEGTGFDLRLRLRDAGIGLRELAFYVPIALILGLWLGFLHTHAGWPGIGPIAVAWIFTFFFIAVPEELFFRGWLQNLLERRLGRYPALFVTAALFGLAHFNKRTTFFNWRYVILAALAGVFYGRAWMRDRRVGASAITHASVDAIWTLWLR